MCKYTKKIDIYNIIDNFFTKKIAQWIRLFC